MISGIMSSILDEFDTDFTLSTRQYSNGNTHLEYLDLSVTSEDEQETPIFRHHPGRRSSVDAEFYSFDDYNPETSHYDQAYDDLINLLRKDEIKSSELSHHNSPRINRIKPRATRKVKSFTEEGCGFCDNQPVSSLYRHDSGSSSSTVTTSSQSSWNLTSDRKNYNRKERGLLKSVEQRIVNNKNVSELHIQNTELYNRTLDHVIQYTPSENSVPLHDGLYSNGIKPMVTMEVEQIYTEPLTQKNTQPKINDDTQRTEELLNGIVKLVKEDIKKPNNKMERTSRRPDKPLKSSKSTPMLNINYKPQSPPIQQQNKKASFVRRSSIVANTALEYFENRKSEKKNKSSPDSQALFDAVEHFEMEKVIQILNADSSIVNAVNSDGFTVLDIAVLTNHVPLTKVLIKYSAKCQFLETYRNEHDLLVHLQSLIQESKQQVVSLSVKITSTSNNSHIKESGKKLNQCEFKHRLFRRMKNGYEQAGTPGQPQNVKLSVSSATSLHVKFDAPEAINGAVVTKYKVEWSCAQNFKPLAGEVILSDIQNLEYEIPGLDKGTPYFVRVTAWNIKGFGRSATPDTSFATPSSWADVEMVDCRFSCYNSIKVRDIGNLVKKYRSTLDAETSSQGSESPPQQRKNSVMVKKGLSRLFSSSAKFQKSIKRGVYLSSVFYHEDKILVTSEDNLPIIEVDENYSSNQIQNDFDWLMKVAATSWDIAKMMKQDMERLSNVGSLLLRSQLLTAVIQLQNMLGIVDLGRLYFKPLKDSSGSLIFVTINHLTDPKQIGNMASVKWQAQNKLMKSASTDALINNIPELMAFTQSSSETLEPGLYLGYLHVKINVESLKVLVPNHNPTVPPHIKIRDCPNVSQPEWDSLLNMSSSNDAHSQYKDTPDTLQFKKLIIKAAKRLFHSLDLPLDQIREHRIYDVEVLEFSKDVSFIMLVPSRDLVCTVQSTGNQGSTETVRYLDVPVKAFEMIHQHTYQDDFITNYSRAACLVDSQLLIAQQSVREAFDSQEIEAARNQLKTIQTYQVKLEDIWRGTRWLMDVITYARDKTAQGVPVSRLISHVSEHRQHYCETTSKISDDGYHSDKLSLGGSTGSDVLHTLNVQTNTNNNNVGTSYDEPMAVQRTQNPQQEQLGPGVLRVYAAYNSGLAKGTSVLLHVTTRSTAREVIDLVVMQLNQAVISKGLTAPIYQEAQLEDFCLAAVIGVRERVLRDDYRLLQLQNPWTHGRLYVRMKDNLLAALEHGEITAV